MGSAAARALWFAFATLVSVLVGILGGILSYLGGDSVAKAIIAGGATFTATLTLAVLVLVFLADGPNSGRNGAGEA